MRKLIIGLLAGSLFLAIALQFLPVIIPPPPSTKTGPLADKLPSELPGWTVRDVPIADTEEMKAQVEQRLVYDDHVVRLFERGSTGVMVYIAYWGPGKMPYRMVGAHSPDTCWVQNGWERKDRAQWAKCPAGSTFRDPIEFGVYDRQGQQQDVIFWHLVGGETYGFEQLGGHNAFGVFHDFQRFGLQQRREQFFIRISSNRRIADLWLDPSFQEIIRPILALGIPAGTPPLATLPGA